MYVLRDIQARSRNHRFRDKKNNNINITYSVRVYVCSISYPACNAHAPYCHLWLAPLYSIFPHYLLNGKILGKKKTLLETKCVFWFHLQTLSTKFLILRRTERDVIKNVYRSACTVPVTVVRS